MLHVRGAVNANERFELIILSRGTGMLHMKCAVNAIERQKLVTSIHV